MSPLTISQVARQVGLRPSAIRYYERLGILPPAERISGQRRYDRTVLYRLAVIQWARQAGFSLEEIRALFFAFREGTRAEARWRKFADRKLVELNALERQIASMQSVLDRMKVNCHCKTLEICGKAIVEKGISAVEGPSFASTQVSRPKELSPISRFAKEIDGQHRMQPAKARRPPLGR